MMATTHALMGVALAALALSATGDPSSTTAVLTAAFVGGIVPDLDLVGAHRKTLHFPVLLPVATGVVGCWVFVSGSAAGLVLVAFLAAAAVHSAIDVFGGGVEPEPWKRTSNEAVYNHYLGRWHAPRRWVRYAGAPEDFLVAAVCGAVAVRAAVTGPTFDRLLLGTVLFSGLFAACRKRIPDIVEYATTSHRRS